ncbi:MAG: squalene/phytoene synthase family protein, partial [Bacteroidota bacterium]|nr:squalene/phytoene synthase family protein [Bacteroidota bacterium]
IDFNKIIDHPNILIAAGFWEADRYGAAKTCYKLMRTIDDLIDDYKSAHPVITKAEQTRLMAEVNQWIRAIAGQKSEETLSKEILDTFKTYQIPVWPMEAFAKSMLYDIHHDGFASLQAFLDYAEGASVAPAAIFVHLCGLNRTKEGQFTMPAFDVQAAARPCAIFSYLVHIIRDFQKDQFHHLNYFADDLVHQYGLDRTTLNDMAHGAPIEPGFRQMIRAYLLVADDYRQQTYLKIQEIKPLLEPRYQLSLEIIFNLYLMVFERIDVEHGCFTTEELNPTPEEVKARVYETIARFTQPTNV